MWAIVLTVASSIFTAHASTPKNLSQFPEGERLIYMRVIDAFHKNKLLEALHETAVLERDYPSSIHLDNAYYLVGSLEYQNNQLGEALKSFGIVRDKFEKSNKRPAALFAMAMTYERLNLGPQARHAFDGLMKEYPGSPEAQRAWMHLQLLRNGKASYVKR